MMDGDGLLGWLSPDERLEARLPPWPLSRRWWRRLLWWQR
jgi:hypothetical protein